MNKTIEIIVSPAGQTRLETRGFSGSECQEASRFLEQALGDTSNEQMTPEYFSPVQAERAEERAGQ